jgi:hypothetical protein
MVGPHPLLAGRARANFLHRSRGQCAQVDDLRHFHHGASPAGSGHRSALGDRSNEASTCCRRRYEDIGRKCRGLLGWPGYPAALVSPGGDSTGRRKQERRNHLANIHIRSNPKVALALGGSKGSFSTIILVPDPSSVLDLFQGQCIRRDFLTGSAGWHPEPGPGEVFPS